MLIVQKPLMIVLLGVATIASPVTFTVTAEASEARRSYKNVPLLLRPLDRMARAIDREIRCGCLRLPLVKCPCSRHRQARPAPGPVDPARSGDQDVKPAILATSAGVLGASLAEPGRTEPAHITRAVADGEAMASPEILGLGLTPVDVARLRGASFEVQSTRFSALLATTMTRLAVPPAKSAREAVEIARRLAPERTFELNHTYVPAHAKFRSNATPCGQACRALQVTDWDPAFGRCAAGATIGVIDTRVDVVHPSLRQTGIEFLSATSADRQPSRADHGTAVVSQLIGKGSALAAQARVIAVDAFHLNGQRDVADAYDLVSALDILATRRPDVINMSFSGPANSVLRFAIEQIQTLGPVIVAAAGDENDDPSAGYPARFPGVVAVSSVDLDLRAQQDWQPSRRILFAAPGSEISVSIPGNEFAMAHGTSFAAPFVTAAYAMAIRLIGDKDQATRLLASGAQDLGPPGRDPASGWGLIRFSALPRC